MYQTENQGNKLSADIRICSQDTLERLREPSGFNTAGIFNGSQSSQLESRPESQQAHQRLNSQEKFCLPPSSSLTFGNSMREKNQKSESNGASDQEEQIGDRPELLKQEMEGRVLVVKDLRKTFANGFQAVKGISVKMYTGQIFALLGHNGAGKTTVISMLTGLLTPTSGEAEVFGMDVFEDIQ